jgi:hypothetical protein
MVVLVFEKAMTEKHEKKMNLKVRLLNGAPEGQN